MNNNKDDKHKKHFPSIVSEMVFERSDGLLSFGCVNPKGVGMNGFGGW